jgi:hypothetical protein
MSADCEMTPCTAAAGPALDPEIPEILIRVIVKYLSEARSHWQYRTQ